MMDTPNQQLSHFTNSVQSAFKVLSSKRPICEAFPDADTQPSKKMQKNSFLSSGRVAASFEITQSGPLLSLTSPNITHKAQHGKTLKSLSSRPQPVMSKKKSLFATITTATIKDQNNNNPFLNFSAFHTDDENSNPNHRFVLPEEQSPSIALTDNKIAMIPSRENTHHTVYQPIGEALFDEVDSKLFYDLMFNEHHPLETPVTTSKQQQEVFPIADVESKKRNQKDREEQDKTIFNQFVPIESLYDINLYDNDNDTVQRSPGKTLDTFLNSRTLPLSSPSIFNYTAEQRSASSSSSLGMPNDYSNSSRSRSSLSPSSSSLSNHTIISTTSTNNTATVQQKNNKNKKNNSQSCSINSIAAALNSHNKDQDPKKIVLPSCRLGNDNIFFAILMERLLSLPNNIDMKMNQKKKKKMPSCEEYLANLQATTLFTCKELAFFHRWKELLQNTQNPECPLAADSLLLFPTATTTTTTNSSTLFEQVIASSSSSSTSSSSFSSLPPIASSVKAPLLIPAIAPKHTVTLYQNHYHEIERSMFFYLAEEFALYRNHQSNKDSKLLAFRTICWTLYLFIAYDVQYDMRDSVALVTASEAMITQYKAATMITQSEQQLQQQKKKLLEQMALYCHDYDAVIATNITTEGTASATATGATGATGGLSVTHLLMIQESIHILLDKMVVMGNKNMILDLLLACFVPFLPYHHNPSKIPYFIKTIFTLETTTSSTSTPSASSSTS